MMTIGLMLAQTGAGTAGGVGTGAWLIWGIVLLVVAVTLFFVEVFLPTGGVLGVAAGGCAVVGIVFLFRVDTTLGMFSAAACLLAAPFLLAFGLKLWPDTPFGRWVTLQNEEPPAATEGRLETTADQLGVEALSRSATGVPAIGDEGQSVTSLRPVGVCLLHGRREECLARGPVIDPGSRIRVVAIEGGEIWVKAIRAPVTTKR